MVRLMALWLGNNSVLNWAVWWVASKEISSVDERVGKLGAEWAALSVTVVVALKVVQTVDELGEPKVTQRAVLKAFYMVDLLDY